jgi:hypothetical protein
VNSERFFLGSYERDPSIMPLDVGGAMIIALILD